MYDYEKLLHHEQFTKTRSLFLSHLVLHYSIKNFVDAKFYIAILLRATQNELALESFFPQSYVTIKRRDISESVDFWGKVMEQFFFTM